MNEIFIGCTNSLLVSGHGYKAAILVRVEFNRNPDGSVALTSTGGHTGTRITQAQAVNISAEEWEAHPHDPADSLVQAKWALAKTGWI